MLARLDLLIMAGLRSRGGDQVGIRIRIDAWGHVDDLALIEERLASLRQRGLLEARCPEGASTWWELTAEGARELEAHEEDAARRAGIGPAYRLRHIFSGRWELTAPGRVSATFDTPEQAAGATLALAQANRGGTLSDALASRSRRPAAQAAAGAPWR